MLATLRDVKVFFGMTIQEFKAEWPALSDQEKEEIRRGIGDGTYTY